MKNKIVTADVLYLDGFRKVQHQAKRCNIKRCRLIYWNNYAWIGKKKIGTVALGDIQEIFVTDKTGFSKDFLEYHKDLHFRATYQQQQYFLVLKGNLKFQTIEINVSLRNITKMLDSLSLLLNNLEELISPKEMK